MTYAGIFMLVVLLSSAKYGSTRQLSWCDAKLCKAGEKHIACDNDGSFHERCTPDAVLVDLKPYRAQILHEHNKRRNFIASGDLPGYYPAARMATMVWDEELEYLALLNLKTCQVEHDECMNSYRYPQAGQNLAGVHRYREFPLNPMDVVQQSLNLWFGEYPVIDSSFLTEFIVREPLEKYGHFAITVLDRNTHVGCGMLRYTNPQYPFLYIYNVACNYASVYALNLPVYSVGEPTSRCETGPHPKYPFLCTEKEQFNPTYYAVTNEV